MTEFDQIFDIVGGFLLKLCFTLLEIFILMIACEWLKEEEEQIPFLTK